MSEKGENKSNPRRQSRLKAGAAAAALLVAGGAATEAAHRVIDNDTSYAVSHETKVDSAAEAARQRITNDIALEHYVNVAEGVTAIVRMKDGSQVNIENPIVEQITEENGGDLADSRLVVAERTPGSDAGEGTTVTTYNVGEDGVESIVYIDEEHTDGTPTLDFGQFGNVDRMPVVRHDGLSIDDPGREPGNFFVPGPEADSAFKDLRIAQGTHYPADN